MDTEPLLTAGVVVRVTYWDPFMEFDEGSEDDPTPHEVVGWLLPTRWENWVSIAAEKSVQGWRAVTHIPVCSVIARDVLRSDHG